MSKPVEVIVKYDPRGKRIRERPRLCFFTGTETLVKQEFKDECDINVLMKRYQKTGLFPQPAATPRYVNNIGAPTYQESLGIVMEAQSMFASLNSELRKRFDNDPAKFLEFCSDPKNGDELIKLGLREPPASKPDPVEVRVVPGVDVGTGDAVPK